MYCSLPYIVGVKTASHKCEVLKQRLAWPFSVPFGSHKGLLQNTFNYCRLTWKPFGLCEAVATCAFAGPLIFAYIKPLLLQSVCLLEKALMSLASHTPCLPFHPSQRGGQIVPRCRRVTDGDSRHECQMGASQKDGGGVEKKGEASEAVTVERGARISRDSGRKAHGDWFLLGCGHQVAKEEIALPAQNRGSEETVRLGLWNVNHFSLGYFFNAPFLLQLKLIKHYFNYSLGYYINKRWKHSRPKNNLSTP